MTKRLFDKMRLIALLASLGLSTSIAFAQEFYPVMGYVDTVSESQLRVNDMLFRVSPTVKVILEDKSSGSMDNLTKQSFIGATTITINQKILIDTIFVLPSPE